jgi:hypothetical protein
MRLKTTKRLLNLCSLLVLGASGAVGYWGTLPISGIDDEPATSETTSSTASLTGRTTSLAGRTKTPGMAMPGAGPIGATTNWARPLRRPLFDPPPPVRVVAKPVPQPLRVKLLATVIEDENTTAMLRLASGQVVFRKVGESLAPDDPNAAIDKIEIGAISVHRGEEKLRVSVEGTNGK